MKNRSWLIILIMGVALAISLVYSIKVSQRKKEPGESTVTTKSIIEMTATTITIKNTLTGNGIVELEPSDVKENLNEDQNIINQEVQKKYIITLSIEDRDLDKAQIGQEVEISIKNNDDLVDYLGKVIKINEVLNNKSTINIEVLNPNDYIKEKMQAVCTIIIEKAENVVALPIEAIQKDEDNKEYVDIVDVNGLTNKKYITTGISDNYYVEITSGLKVGDRVQIIKSLTTVIEKNYNTAKY